MALSRHAGIGSGSSSTVDELSSFNMLAEEAEV